MFKYIRQLADLSYRRDKFWTGLPGYQEYDFKGLKEWCGLDLDDDCKSKPWWEIFKEILNLSKSLIL